MSSNSNSNAAQNDNTMYRIGDYVYFENSSSASYAIRRIEELNRSPTGNVEARVMCFYRRSEVPTNLVAQADRHHWGESDAHHEPDALDSDDEDAARDASERAERALLKEREVFLSRQVETLPATLIRGKCSVTLLSEVETSASYCKREDAFFYALVYDPNQKTLVADRGEIRIGAGYQATVPQLLGEDEADDRGDGEVDETGRVFPELEKRLWVPPTQKKSLGTNGLSDTDIDKFLVVARSVGTFARALDCSSSVKQPSLHMSAAAASRDITLFHAYDLLHQHGYDTAEALKALVPDTGPMLCRDEMEDWSASEANLFEEAIDKYGKDFNDIRKDFLPWKTMKNIIEYFFMWKTTDRYVQQKRIKAMEAESKLKQVFVPAYSNKTTRLTGSNGEIIIRGRDCDAYPNLSRYSWTQYKKYGKFVSAKTSEDSFILDKSTLSTAQRLAQLRPGLIIEPGSPAVSASATAGKSGSGKTRAAFFLRATPLTRASRRLCENVAKLQHYARRPGKLIDMKAVKADAIPKMMGMNERKLRHLNAFKPKTRVKMDVVVKRLGQEDDSIHQWLVLTPKDQLPKPEKEAYPRPQKRSDGSYIYDRIPSYNSFSGNNILYKKRAYDEKPPAEIPQKLQRTDGRQHIPNVVPPKGRVATLTRIQGGQRQVISWMDAPDDVFYKATPSTKRWRKRMPVTQLRRAARKPFKKVLTLQ